MLILRTAAAMHDAALTYPNRALRALLAKRIEQLTGDHELDDVVNFLVVEPGDLLANIDAALGFPILRNLVDGTVFGDPDFMPSFEWMQCHCGWFEIVYLLTDDGFGTIVLVQDHPGIEFDLHALCLEYAPCR